MAQKNVNVLSKVEIILYFQWNKNFSDPVFLRWVNVIKKCANHFWHNFAIRRLEDEALKPNNSIFVVQISVS